MLYSKLSPTICLFLMEIHYHLLIIQILVTCVAKNCCTPNLQAAGHFMVVFYLLFLRDSTYRKNTVI